MYESAFRIEQNQRNNAFYKKQIKKEELNGCTIRQTRCDASLISGPGPRVEFLS